MRALAFQTVRDRGLRATGAALLSVLFLVPVNRARVPLRCRARLAEHGYRPRRVGRHPRLRGGADGGAAATVPRGTSPRRSPVATHRRRPEAAGGGSGSIGPGRPGRGATASTSWAEIRIGILNEHLTAFGAAVPLLAAAVLFAAAYWREDGALGVGEFLVAYVASMIFYASVVALGAAFESIASVGPACEQVLPILGASPEAGSRPGPPAVLGGALRFESVSFRYDDTGPPVLDGVDIHASPGEFIAIIGESGAGKSTLVRLALGLETPTGGAVYYDGSRPCPSRSGLGAPAGRRGAPGRGRSDRHRSQQHRRARTRA